jgi:hypothetical protein
MWKMKNPIKILKMAAFFAIALMQASLAQAADAESTCSLVEDQSAYTIEYAGGSLPTFHDVYTALQNNGQSMLDHIDDPAIQHSAYDDSGELVNFARRNPSDQANRFYSIPKKGKGDNACADKSLTGLECRDQGLMAYDLASGLETEVYLMAHKSAANKEKLNLIIDDLGCRAGASDSGASHAPPGVAAKQGSSRR